MQNLLYDNRTLLSSRFAESRAVRVSAPTGWANGGKKNQPDHRPGWQMFD